MTHDPTPDTSASPPAQILRARGPADLLAVLPYLLHLRPGPGELILLTVRENLIGAGAFAPTSSTDDLQELWAALKSGVPGDGQDGQSAQYGRVLIAYTGPETVPALRAIIASDGPRMYGALRVHQDRFWTLAWPGTRGQGLPEGILLPDGSGPLGEQFALEGTMQAPPDRAGLAAWLQPGPPALLAAVSAHLDALTSPAADVPAARELFEALRGEHERRAERPAPLRPQRAALLLLALRDVRIRDLCLAWDDTAAWWLWEELIRHAPAGWAAPVATLIAATAYRNGHGPQIRVALERALSDDPAYVFAGMLTQIRRLGITPEKFRQVMTEQTAKLPGPEQL
jgi:hypothetical protein